VITKEDTEFLIGARDEEDLWDEGGFEELDEEDLEDDTTQERKVDLVREEVKARLDSSISDTECKNNDIQKCAGVKGCFVQGRECWSINDHK